MGRMLPVVADRSRPVYVDGFRPRTIGHREAAPFTDT